MSLKQVAEALRRHETFYISAHVGPEGDALGSEVALGLALRSLAKKVTIVNLDPVPKQLSFLATEGLVRQVKRLEEPADALVVVDCGDAERTGLFEFGRPPVASIINVDHHITNKRFGDINWVEERASATGEMIYDLLNDMQIPITPQIATALYTTLITETGSFHYSNTTPKVLRISADLIERGADSVKIARAVFETTTAGRLRLLSEVLGTLSLSQDGKLAWVHIPLEAFARSGTTPEDTENFVNYPRSIAGVEAAALFRQAGPASYKISFRGQGKVDVSQVALEFGGGGHKNAAGCSLEGTLAEVQGKVLGRLTAALPRPGAAPS